MAKEKEMTDELKDFIIDPSKDYRQILTMWRVDEDGNLIWVKTRNGTNKSYYIIEKSQLKDGDWLTYMRGKMDADEFGEFACAYFKACEMAGITELKVKLRGEFDRSFKFADKE